MCLICHPGGVFVSDLPSRRCGCVCLATQKEWLCLTCHPGGVVVSDLPTQRCGFLTSAVLSVVQYCQYWMKWHLFSHSLSHCEMCSCACVFMAA